MGGSLSIHNNEKLTFLKGLEGLEQIGVDLNIYDNGKLTNLAGLANVAVIGRNLFIIENSNLPTSEASELADRAAGGEV